MDKKDEYEKSSHGNEVGKNQKPLQLGTDNHIADDNLAQYRRSRHRSRHQSRYPWPPTSDADNKDEYGGSPRRNEIGGDQKSPQLGTDNHVPDDNLPISDLLSSSDSATHLPAWPGRRPTLNFGKVDTHYPPRAYGPAPTPGPSHFLHPWSWNENHKKGSSKHKRFISDNLKKPFGQRVLTFGVPDLFYPTNEADGEFHVNLSSLQRINLHILQKEVLNQITKIGEIGVIGENWVAETRGEEIRIALKHYGMSS